ncbi:MAG: phage holin family protein [Patescibacteria group bacterium]
MRRIIFSFLGNILGLTIATMIVTGFMVEQGIANFLIVGGLLTLLNAFIRPIIKLFVLPLIILTLGLFSLIVNAGMLAFLDFLSKELTISGLIPLAFATLILTLANLIAHALGKQNS